MSQVVIAGGGVIGLCTAWYAAARGNNVTVVDRGSRMHPGCSWGNAGMITPSHFIPLAAPGIVRTALKWMWDSESPFYVRPRLDADLLRWGWKFARAATAAHVERAAPLLLQLNLAGLECYRELSEQWGRPFGLVERGMLMLCATAHGLDEERRTAAFAHRLGVAAEILDAREIRELEPGVRLSIAGGAYYPHDAIFSPVHFMQSMIERLEAAGVEIRWDTDATRFRSEGARITTLETSRGAIEGDEFAVCGGAWSPALLRALGLRLPMQAGKGYSLTLPSPREKPTRGVILTEARVAVTPMGESLRFGGTMEMAGINERINPSRVRGIVKSACRYFPDYGAADFEDVQPWCGLRPCSPDGLPYIGRFRRYRNLSTATGHAMMGMSLGPITGRLMAEVLSADATSMDIRTLSPDRYH